jgi:DNA-binding NarL/FixJ family response regulator
MVRIVIADDHCLMREGLRRILGSYSDIEVVGEAVDEHEVMTHVRGGAFDILLLDLSMPGAGGIELIRRIRSCDAAARVLVLTMHDEQHYAVRALRAGAQGYLTKQGAESEIIRAISHVSSGRLYISQRVAEQLAFDVMAPDMALPHAQLSDRELQVFSLIVNGASVSSAAAALDVSVKTISTHKTRILQKMGLHSVAEMIQYAIAQGLLPPSGKNPCF